eukprot:1803375-Rhodomonas_salina.1
MGRITAPASPACTSFLYCSSWYHHPQAAQYTSRSTTQAAQHQHTVLAPFSTALYSILQYQSARTPY